MEHTHERTGLVTIGVDVVLKALSASLQTSQASNTARSAAASACLRGGYGCTKRASRSLLISSRCCTARSVMSPLTGDEAVPDRPHLGS